MKKDVKDKWLAALRSGQYKQGIGSLRDKDNNYCPIGVLCDVLGMKSSLSDGAFKYCYYYKNLPFSAYLFPIIAEDIGVSGHLHTLILLNDKYRLSFNLIADYIEANIDAE